jgi:integrase
MEEISVQNFIEFETNTINNFYNKNPELKTKKQQLKLKFALLETQINDLLDLAFETNVKHHDLIVVELDSGLRVSEIANLIIPQINFTSQLIEIVGHEKTKYYNSFKLKTPHSHRFVPFSKKAGRCLRNQIGKRKNGYVFQSNKGGNYNKRSIIKFINKYANRCPSINRNIGSHALRRTYASYLINDPKKQKGDKQITISDISKLLGHKTIKTTMEYLFKITNLVDYDKIRTAINRFHK